MTPTSSSPSPTGNCAELTVIMPVYNEATCIREVIAEVSEHVLARIPRSQLLVVDDGSTDGSPAILDAIARGDPAIHVLRKKNGGHGEALLWGLRHAEGEFFFLVDADGQIPLDKFAALWGLRAPDAFVCGVRRKREDPAHRRLLTRLVVGGVWLLFGRRLRDSNAPCKLFPREFWLRASARVPEKTLAPSLFLALLASRDPLMRLIEAQVDHRPRKAGKSTLRPWRLLRFCAQAFGQLMALRRAVGGR